jgi:hypothetical protein
VEVAPAAPLIAAPTATRVVTGTAGLGTLAPTFSLSADSLKAAALPTLPAQNAPGFVPVRLPAPTRTGTIAALEKEGKLPANSGSGLTLFDGGALRDEATLLAPAADGRSHLSPPSAAPAARSGATPLPLGRRIGAAAEVGMHATGWQILTGILFLTLGSRIFFPALAGAFWGWGGAVMLEGLAKSRAVIVGGWQASHDQKMRTDYQTGKLIDIRGRAYGEDRYDRWAPGPVSERERGVLDTAALALGLPWVWALGPKAIALYGASALAVVALRRWRSRRHPAPAPPSNTDFEYDR